MKLRIKPLLLLVPVLFVAACGGGNDLDDRLDLADPKVRFLDAIQTGPNVTLYKDGVAQSDANNVGYKFASKYFDVATDTAPWLLRTTPGNVTLSNITLNAQRGNRYTFVGLPGTTTGEMILVRDPYNKGLVSDKARVRGINASGNMPNVDVYLTQPNVSLAGVGPNLGGIGYKQAVPGDGSDSIELNGGSYQVRVTTAGTKNVIFTASVSLPNNSDWLLLTVPDGALPNSIKLLLAKSDDDSRTVTEVGNASP